MPFVTGRMRENAKRKRRGIESVCVMCDVRRAVNVEGCAGLEMIITTEDSREEMGLVLKWKCEGKWQTTVNGKKYINKNTPQDF